MKSESGSGHGAPGGPRLGRLDEDGFASVESLLDPHDLNALREAFELSGPGSRNALETPSIAALAKGLATSDRLRSLMGPTPRCIGAKLFDKTAEQNWLVAWHQDLSVAVQARRDCEGWSAWSVKAGVPYGRPPTAILEGLLTIRISLDEVGREGGALRVRPGSHRHGILSSDAIAQRWVECTPQIPAGGALLMRPLLLHASSRAALPARRRVVHLEFAPAALPLPLAFWHECTGPA